MLTTLIVLTIVAIVATVALLAALVLAARADQVFDDWADWNCRRKPTVELVDNTTQPTLYTKDVNPQVDNLVAALAKD